MINLKFNIHYTVYETILLHLYSLCILYNKCISSPPIINVMNMVYLYLSQSYFFLIIKYTHNSCFSTLEHLFTHDYDLFNIELGQKHRKKK